MTTTGFISASMNTYEQPNPPQMVQPLLEAHWITDAQLTQLQQVPRKTTEKTHPQTKYLNNL